MTDFSCVAVKPLVAGVVACATAMPIAANADWLFDGGLDVSAEYNDNIRLSADAKTSAFTNYDTIRFAVLRQTARTNVELRPRFVLTRYSVAGADNNHGQVDVAWRSTTLRGSYGLNGAYVDTSTLVSELADTGLLQVHKWHRRMQISPYWEHRFSQRTLLRASLDSVDAAYQPGAGLANYAVRTADLSLSRELGQRNSISVLVSASEFSVEATGLKATTYRYEGGARHDLSEKVNGQASLGISRTSSRTSSGYSVDSTKTIVGAALSGTDTTWSWRTAVNRTLEGSGSGTLVQRDRAALSFNYAFSATLNGGLNGYVLRNDDIIAVRMPDRYFAEIAANIFGRSGRRLNWSVGYRLRWQRYDATGPDASSNAIIAGITINTPSF